MGWMVNTKWWHLLTLPIVIPAAFVVHIWYKSFPDKNWDKKCSTVRHKP